SPSKMSMISSMTRVMGWTGPGGMYRPGSVRSRVEASSDCRCSAAFSASRRSAMAASTLPLARLASWPTRGRSDAGMPPSARRSPVSSPERPSTRTRTCSRSDVDRAPATSARARSRTAWTWSAATLCVLGPGRLRELGEGGLVGDGQLGEDLAVDLDARLLQPVHEDGIRQPELATGGVDADDPERACPPLLLLAALVGEGPRAEHGFRGGAVQLAPAAEVPLGLLENLLSALAGLGPASGPWHVRSPLPILEIGDEPVEPRLVRLGHQGGLAEMALALGPLPLGLVTLPAAAALQQPGRRALQAFGGRPLRLH